MPQQPTVRRAKPLDVVNLYRLVSEQGETDVFDLSDEARALAFVLDVIVNGYALVAENKAGRLVGAIGFYPVDPKSVGCFWFTISPPYTDGDLAADLLDLSIRAASYAGLDVHFAPSLLDDEEALTTLGFKRAERVWIRKAKNKKNGAKAHVEKAEEAQAAPSP